MERSLKLSFQKGDWIAIISVVVLCVAVALFFGNLNGDSQPEAIQIFQNNQLIAEYPLQNDNRIVVQGEYCNIVEISDGRVAITESDCPGTDCVHSGWIGQAGRSIVCLPNKVEVRIVGTSNDVDFVVR